MTNDKDLDNTSAAIDTQPRYTTARLLSEVARAKAAARFELLEELEKLALRQSDYFRVKQNDFQCLEDLTDEEGEPAAEPDIGSLISGGRANGRYSEADWWLSTFASMKRTTADLTTVQASSYDIAFVHAVIENAVSSMRRHPTRMFAEHMDRLIAETRQGMTPDQAADWTPLAPETPVLRSVTVDGVNPSLVERLEEALRAAKAEGLVHVTGTTIGSEAASDACLETHLAVLENVLRLRRSRPAPVFSTGAD